MKAKNFKILVEIDYTDVTKAIQLFKQIKESDLTNHSSFEKKINAENKLKITNYLFNQNIQFDRELEIKPIWGKKGFKKIEIINGVECAIFSSSL
jgi:hypothetical protein